VARLADIDVPSGLLASARQGVDSARARLYAAVAPATFGLICRLIAGRAAAEDLFQETMLTVFERLESFRGEAPLGAWVRQIALSKCLMYLRSPWQRARLGLAAWGEESQVPEPAARPESPADRIDVERALASLTPTARAVVWLFEVEGYSHQEIAQAFGRTTSFSKSQLARAHRRLREWFEPRSESEPCTPL
jgi:RNA polymerase sigma factor (sigma-70 family)